MRQLRPICIAAFALAASACTTYSSYQSAKTMNPGATSYTAALASTTYSVDGMGNGEEIVELMARHGVSEGMDVGGRISRINFDSDGVFFFLIDAKKELIPDQLSVALPIGFALLTGDAVDADADQLNYYQAQPTILYRVPAIKEVDLELTAKGIFVVATGAGDTESEFLIASTIGVRFAEDIAVSKWWIQPEIGFLKDIGEDGYAYQLGFGFTYVP